MAEPNTTSTPSAGHGHSHGHDHGHSHAHASGDLFDHPHVDLPPEKPGFEKELDPANRSLAEALRVSFGILKVVMILLVLAFFFGRWVEVKEGEVAIRLRFGAVQGESGKQMLEPGWHFALPEGIDRIVKLPTTEQRISLDKEFWFEVKPGDETKDISKLAAPPGGLVPGKDGSLITSDKNIVHGQWLVSYRIDKRQAQVFARNTGTLEFAEKLVRNATERAIVHVVARTTADQFLGGGIDLPGIRIEAQDALDKFEAGLTVTGVEVKAKTPPLVARADFSAVSSAESERAQKITAARTEEGRILSDAAGTSYRDMLAVIDAYRDARTSGNAQAVAAADKRVNEYLDRAQEGQGQVFRTISEAIRYRTRVVESVRTEAETFKRLLPLYLENPRIFREKMIQDAQQELFSGDIEKFYLPADAKELYLELNRDPEIRKDRERERYKLEQKAPPKP